MEREPVIGVGLFQRDKSQEKKKNDQDYGILLSHAAEQRILSNLTMNDLVPKVQTRGPETKGRREWL